MEMKVLFVASSGGHLEEISQLKRIAKEYENALVTEKNDAVVTKPILKTAIKNKALIKLTLSLPPFRFPAAHR